MLNFSRLVGVIGLALPCVACGGEIDFGGQPPADDSLVVEQHDRGAPELGEKAPPVLFVLNSSEIALSAEPDESWASGRAVLEPHSNETFSLVSRRAVNPSTLPRDFAGAEGRHVVLYDDKGERCTAQLGPLSLVHRLDPQGEMDFDEDGARRDWNVTPPTAEDVWEKGSDSSFLVSRYQVIDGDCQFARYARFADEQPPRVFAYRGNDVETELADDALALFRALPEYGDVQDDYAVTFPDRAAEGSWEHYDDNIHETALFRDPESGRELVGVARSVGAGCGDFHGALWALFESTPQGLVPRIIRRGEDFPNHVLDFDRNGILEVFSGQEFVFWSKHGPLNVDLNVPYHGCSC